MSSDLKTAPRPLSRYAKKKAEREAGIRAAFQFVNKKTPPTEPVCTATQTPVVTESGDTVTATIAHVDLTQGYVILRTGTTKNPGRGLHLSLHLVTVERPTELQIGSVVKCFVRPRPLERRDAVMRVLSIEPPLKR